jgi:hypothetical protein
MPLDPAVVAARIDVRVAELRMLGALTAVRSHAPTSEIFASWRKSASATLSGPPGDRRLASPVAPTATRIAS